MNVYMYSMVSNRSICTYSTHIVKIRNFAGFFFFTSKF